MTALRCTQKFPIAMKAATLLDDPIMMEWAVHYYHDLPPHPELTHSELKERCNVATNY